MRTRRGIMLLVCVVLGLSGTAIGEARAADDELVTTKVERAGIRIDVPKGWSGRDIDPETLVRNLKKLRRTDPALAKYILQTVNSGAFEHSRLLAIDPSNGDTLNIMSFNNTGITLDEIKAGSATTPQMQAAGISPAEITDTQAGGYPAVRITRVITANNPDFPSSVFHTELDVEMPKHRGLTIGLVVDDTPKERALVDRIIGSIRPL